MSNEKMSADELIADLQHVHDIYGIDLSRTIRGVAALIADRNKMLAAIRLAVALDRVPDSMREILDSAQS